MQDLGLTMPGINFLGDVFLPKSFRSLLGELNSYCVNLEAAITHAAEGAPDKINLKTSSNFLKDTFGSDPIAVCLANNHIMDFGPTGFKDTINNLSERRIPWFGAGTLEENVNNPAIIECEGVACALLGYVCPTSSPVFAGSRTPGVAPPETSRIASDIVHSKEAGARRVIVSLHWGAENVPLPRPVDIDLARSIIDIGADLIIGHHAHRIQPWESYRGKPIFYGLGNCIFPETTVPSYYKNGVPTAWRRLSQFSWNRQSLAVTYFPAKGTFEANCLTFDGATLRYNRQKKPPFLRITNHMRYRRRYHLAFLVSKYWLAVARFFLNPHWPSLKTLMSLASLVKNTQYK
jgi:poly-gamma-glutamate synthesis protein (capsule biosynthesis protein)